MINKIFFILIAFFALIFWERADAGVVEYTGKATVVNNDLRTAQRNSLQNALIGGLSQHVRSKTRRTGAVTNDYLTFIKDYTILKRELVENVVSTTVRINIDDMITQEIATQVAPRVNTAVFLVSGLPQYTNSATVRSNLTNIFNLKQFATKEQIAFEQEIIDPKNRADVENAFLAVGSQYLFELNFDIKSYVAGESCTLVVDARYRESSNLARVTPIQHKEITIEEGNTTNCIYQAVNEASESALNQVRQSLIVSPGAPMVLHKYTVIATGLIQLKELNDVMNDLKRRKYLISSAMSEFSVGQAIYTVESYFTTQDLASRITSLNFGTINNIQSTPINVSFEMKVAND